MSRSWPAGLVLILAGFLVYANSFSGSFHYDDFHSIVDNPHIRSLAEVPAFFADPRTFSGDPEKKMYRPLVVLSYALNYAAGGYQVAGYHLVNLLVHLGCGLLVWRLARHLVGEGAWLAGLLFVVHPLGTEPVNYISSRSESLAALGYLGALLAHLKAETSPAWRWATLACFGAALLCKEMALTLPAALLLVDRWRGRWTRWRAYLPPMVLALAYVGVLLANRFLGDALAAPVHGAGEQAWTQAKALGYYLRLATMPQALNVEHQFALASAPNPAVLAALALVLSLAIAAWWGRSSLPGLVAAWGVLVLLPVLAMPLNMLVNERRLYLVVAGLCWLLAWALRGRLRLWFCLLVLVAAGLTWSRNEAWRDELSLWRDARSKAPAMYRVQTNLGKALQLAGDTPGAVAAYQAAIALDDRHGDAYNNLATILHQQGRFDEAIGWYRQALQRYPGNAEIYQNLADAYSQKGDLVQAAAMYGEALRLEPENGPAWNNCGQTLYLAGRLAEAEAAFQRAVRLLPQQAEPHNNLGNLYSRQGDHLRAIGEYQRALELQPAAEGAVRLNLALALRAAGQSEAAATALGQVLAADPRQVRALVELAELRAGQGRHAEAAALFERALAQDGGQARAWYGLALSRESLAQAPEAASAYRQFLSRWTAADARAAQAREHLRRLEAGR